VDPIVQLLDPIAPADFFGSCWDRRPLHIPGRPDKLAALYDAAGWREARSFRDPIAATIDADGTQREVSIYASGDDREGDPNKVTYQQYHSSHSTENMVVVFAGRAGGLKAGHHIRATDKHPAQVLLTAMNAVGVRGPLGEVSEILPELGVRPA
jgi:hypothetical protein